MFNRFSLKSDPSTPSAFVTGFLLFRRVLLSAGIPFASVCLFVGVWWWSHSSSGQSARAGSANTKGLSTQQPTDMKRLDEALGHAQATVLQPSIESKSPNSKPVDQDFLTLMELIRSNSRNETRTGTPVASDQITKTQDDQRSVLSHRVTPGNNEPGTLLTNDSKKPLIALPKEPIHGRLKLPPPQITRPNKLNDRRAGRFGFVSSLGSMIWSSDGHSSEYAERRSQALRRMQEAAESQPVKPAIPSPPATKP